MFSILVKIDGLETKRRNAVLLHIIVGFFLILKSFDYYHLTANASLLPILPFLAVAAISLYYGFFRRRFDESGKYNQWLRLLQIAAFVVLGGAMVKVGRQIDYYGLFLWAILTVILLFSERRVFNDTVILLQPEGIKIPAQFTDHLLQWQKLESVIVRHDFITIIHKENKYLQYQVMQTLSELEVAKMNAFCRENIERDKVDKLVG